jgi:hypothetical protein
LKPQHLFAVDGLVEVALLGGELDPDNDLLLVRQILHVLLHAPQQHRPQLRLVSTTAKQSIVASITSLEATQLPLPLPGQWDTQYSPLVTSGAFYDIRAEMFTHYLFLLASL